MAYSLNLNNFDHQQSLTTTTTTTTNNTDHTSPMVNTMPSTIKSTQRSDCHRPTAIQNKGIENNLVNGTITIVQEKCKTLILKLSSPNRRYYLVGERIKPEGEINQMIDQLGDDLVRHVTEGVNSIRDEVKRARPTENDTNYQSKIVIYKELLQYVTNLIKELTKVFDQSLTNYRHCVEQLWNDMQCTSDQQLIEGYIQKFHQNSEEIFIHALETYLNPHLTAIQSKFNHITK